MLTVGLYVHVLLYSWAQLALELKSGPQARANSQHLDRLKRGHQLHQPPSPAINCIETWSEWVGRWLIQALECNNEVFLKSLLAPPLPFMSQSFEDINVYIYIYISWPLEPNPSLDKGRINVNQHTILSFAPTKWYGILVPSQTFFTPCLILSRGKIQVSQWIKKWCKINLNCSKTSYPVGPKTSKQTLHSPENPLHV